MTYTTYMTYIIYTLHTLQTVTYSTYSTYITDITYTLHNFTAHPDVWQLRAWEGEGDRGEKKAVLCTFMPQYSPICRQG